MDHRPNLYNNAFFWSALSSVVLIAAAQSRMSSYNNSEYMCTNTQDSGYAVFEGASPQRHAAVTVVNYVKVAIICAFMLLKGRRTVKVWRKGGDGLVDSLVRRRIGQKQRDFQ
jgi:hypothetical protein